MTARPTFAALTCLLASGLSACKEEPQQRPAPATDAGASKGSAVDPSVVAAVAQAARDTIQDESAPSAGGGAKPPENGVFAPGVADGEMPKGAPPRIAVGSEGSGKKVTLRSPAQRPGKEREAALQLAVRTGPRSGLPTMDLLVSFDASKKTGGDDDAPAGVDVEARITSAKLARDQPGRLPAGVEKEIAKIEGSRVRYSLGPDGVGSGFSAEPRPGLEGGLARVVYGVGGLLRMLHLPLPTKPVGAGAFWMVTSREPFAGLDTIAYRMFRLTTIDGENAVLTLSTKRYMAGGQVDFPGLPPHGVDELRAGAEANLVVPIGNVAMGEGRLAESLLASLEPKEDPSRRVTVQFDISATVSFAKGR